MEKRLFHDLINNCPRKNENLKPKGSLCVLLLPCFLFRSSLPKLFSKVAVLKFCKTPLETPTVDFCFSCRAYTFISTETELCSILSFEVWSRYFSRYLQSITVTKSSHRRFSIKNLFLKILQCSQENTCVGVSF